MRLTFRTQFVEAISYLSSVKSDNLAIIFQWKKPEVVIWQKLVKLKDLQIEMISQINKYMHETQLYEFFKGNHGNFH